MTKILFLDFDGTTYSHRYSAMPDSALVALNQAKEKGVKVFLCTGRSKPEMDTFDLKGFEFDGSILNNGQQCIDSKGNIIFSNPLEGQLKEKLLEIFNEKKIPICFTTNNEYYINFINDFVIQVQTDISSGLPPVREYKGEDILMASVFVELESYQKEINQLSDLAEITLWHEGAVDVASKGVTKASAIKEVLKKLNLDIKDTMAFGDGQNDIPMLKECAISVAMGNATDEVKQNADYITTDIDDNGIANALKHFSII